MELTDQINRALSKIQAKDHRVLTNLRQKLMSNAKPTFNKVDGSAFFPIRPSSATKPLRDLFYDLKNFYEPGSIPKAELEPRIELIFQFGHLTEELLKKLCKATFEVQYEQERVKYGELVDRDGSIIPLTGAIDWAMRLDPLSEKLTLCDAKSIGDYPFKSAPKEANIAQMQLYMHSEWGRKNSVNNAVLIYFNKNTSEIKCIEVEYDASLALKLLERFQFLWSSYLKNELPPREYFAGIDWEADYSAYKEYDNQEFTMDREARQQYQIQEYFTPSQYMKEDLKAHAKKFGAGVANYVDKTCYIKYIDGKLRLVIEETF